MVRVISYASFRARHFAIRNSLVTRCRPPSRCARRRDNFSPAWPREKLVGLSRFELLTPRLSSVCSNQLSYRPDPAKASSGKPLKAPMRCQRAR